jgi:Anaphase promoting complex subunit 8 / Cdc23
VLSPSSAQGCLSLAHHESSAAAAPLLALAKSYFDLRQFQRCASTLSPLLDGANSDVRTNLSGGENVRNAKIGAETEARARFLRVYALYLNGEKRAAERATALHSAALGAATTAAGGSDHLNPTLVGWCVYVFPPPPLQIIRSPVALWSSWLCS